MNNVNIIANLTRDPELRYTPQGKAVATLGIAINDGYGDKKKVYFINCVVWEKVAENCNQYLAKGSKVGITGKITQRSWQNKEGKNISVVEILALNVEFLSPPKEQSRPSETIPEEIEEETYIPEGGIPGEECF